MARAKDKISPALGPGKYWSRILQGYELIKIVYLTSPPPEEPFNLFQGPALDLNSTEKDAEGTVFHGYS